MKRENIFSKKETEYLPGNIQAEMSYQI